MLLQLQQRAESWCESGMPNMSYLIVLAHDSFRSTDYGIQHVSIITSTISLFSEVASAMISGLTLLYVSSLLHYLRFILNSYKGKTANRMHVVSIYDLKQNEAYQAFTRMRQRAGQPAVPKGIVREVLEFTGGRLAHLSRISRNPDPLAAAKVAVQNEKGWLLGQIGLIPDCDDDVMDEV